MGFPVLASCQCGWQGAKIGKSPTAEASGDSAMQGVRLHFIIYISVSKSTPLAVTGPHGQLASFTLPITQIGV